MVDRLSLALAVLLLSVASWIHSPAATAGTIEVKAEGVAEAPVSAFLFQFRLVEEDEDAGTAVRDFSAGRAKVAKAFAELSIEGLTVVGGGIEISVKPPSADPFRGVQVLNGVVQGANSKKLARFSETFSVRVPIAADAAPDRLLERIGQVLDVAAEVGLDPIDAPQNPNIYLQPQLQKTGPQVFAVEVAEPAEIRLEAERRAIEEARKRASRLGDLAGLTIGEVQSVRVTRTEPLTSVGGSLVHARQEVELTIIFMTH